PIQARPIGTGERLVNWASRNRTVATLSASVLSMLLALAVVATVAYIRTATALEHEAAARTLASRPEGEMRRQRDNGRRTPYHSLVGEAAATRQARQVGYRERVFDLLRQAGGLDTPDRDPAALRHEAARSLGDFVALSPHIPDEGLRAPMLAKVYRRNGYGNREFNREFDPRTGQLAMAGTDGKAHFF